MIPPCFSSFTNINFIEIHSDDGLHTISLDNSIILFHAIWSGYSVASIQKILPVLNNFNLSSTKVYFVNIDMINPANVKELLGQPSHGYGEAVLYKNGSIAAKRTNANELVSFLSFMEASIE